MKTFIQSSFIVLFGLAQCTLAQAEEAPAQAVPTPPNTGISGVYEVVLAAKSFAPVAQHFALFGFREIKRATLTATQAKALYGVNSAVTSIRMQNGNVDSHGLLRVLVWEKPLGDGVGYAPPETIGQRMAVMMTSDIMRIDDVFKDARAASQPWLPITPVYADLFGLTDGKPDLNNRRIGVRESGVYGELFNHVFFQRYGYTIKGYGTINEQAPLKASEFTHHDFIINTDITASTDYYRSVLGFKAENEGVIDGDWLEGPSKIFGMNPGTTHYYRGFVSPNNVCGKLKFFRPRDLRADRSKHQRLGELGVTLHTLYTPKLDMVYRLASRAGLKPSTLANNEFGERSFLLTGPDHVIWQILDAPKINRVPVAQLEIIKNDPPVVLPAK